MTDLNNDEKLGLSRFPNILLEKNGGKSSMADGKRQPKRYKKIRL